MLKNEALSINQAPDGVCRLKVVPVKFPVAFLSKVIVLLLVLNEVITVLAGRLALSINNEDVVKLKSLTLVIIFEPILKLPVIEFGKLLKVVTDRDPFLSDDILYLKLF
jgi:hypothetical protein